MKGLYALAFVLSSFAACAQTPDASTMLVFDLDDYFGEITELSTSAPQITATEPMTGNSGEADTSIRGDSNPEDVPVGAIQPSSESVSAQAPIWWDDRLSFEDLTKPSAVPAQIVANEQILEKFGDAAHETNSIAGSIDAAAVPSRLAPEALDTLVGGIHSGELGADVSLK